MFDLLHRPSWRCAMGVHTGPIETATVDAERGDLTLTFRPCSRCGELVPLNLRPAHETKRLLGYTRRKKYR